MKLYEGKNEEYKKRHDALWQEMKDMIHNYGGRNYSIFFDEETNTLFEYIEFDDENLLNYSQVSRHKKAHFFRGAGYFVCSQYKASASFGVSILSVPCGLFVL